MRKVFEDYNLKHGVSLEGKTSDLRPHRGTLRRVGLDGSTWELSFFTLYTSTLLNIGTKERHYFVILKVLKIKVFLKKIDY